MWLGHRVEFEGTIYCSAGHADNRTHDLELLSACSWPLEEAYSVFWCESGGDWGAVSNGNWGGLQINEIHAARVGGDLSLLLVPEINVAVACAIYEDWGSWNPWACKPEVTP